MNNEKEYEKEKKNMNTFNTLDILIFFLSCKQINYVNL